MFGYESQIYSNLTVGVWSALPSVPTVNNWIAISISFTGQFQYAVPSFGNVYASSDYGMTWRATDSPTLDWVDITTSTSGNFIAAIDSAVTGQQRQSTIYLSEDYGASWTSSLIETSNNDKLEVLASSCSGQYLATMGNFSSCINTSPDYGQSWDVPFACTSPIYYNDIAISCNGVIKIAVAENNKFGNGGGVYLDTGNGFPTNPSMEISPNNHLTSCAINRDGSIMYAVDSTVLGGLYYSIKSGVWTKLISTGPASKLYFDVVVCDQSGQHILISYSSASSGYSYGSENGGKTWGNTWSTQNSQHVYTLLPPTISMSGDGNLAACAGWDTTTPIKSTPTSLFLYSRCPLGYTVQFVTTKNGSYSCEPCAAGSYLASYDFTAETGQCTACPDNTYNKDEGGASKSVCLDCPFPTATVNSGAVDCTAVYIGLSLTVQLSLYATALAWFVYVISKGNQQTLAAFSILVFPLLDVFTDFAYLMSSKFYNSILFIMCAVMFLHPMVLLLYKLYKYEAFPTSLWNIWWIGYSSSAIETSDIRNTMSTMGTVGANTNQDMTNLSNTNSSNNNSNNLAGDHIPFPTIYGKRFELIVSFQSHANIFILAWEIFTWMVAVFAQMVTLLFCPLFLFVWLWLGVFFQMSKTISMSSVWNMWFYVWTGDHHLDDIGGGFVDTEELNYGLLSQFLLETVPHIVLQSINNTLLHSWDSDPIAIASFAASSLMAFNAIYHYFYHSHILAEPLNIRDVPLDRSIRMGCCGTSYLCLDAKLKSYAKVIAGFDGAENLKSNYVQVPNDEQRDTKPPREFQRPIDNTPKVYEPPALPTYSPVRPPDVSYANATAPSPTDKILSQYEYIPTATAMPLTDMEAQQLQYEPATVVKSLPNNDVESADPMHSNNTVPSSVIPSTTSQVTAKPLSTYLPPRAPPAQLLCPLSHRMMTDPVIAEDGYTYERGDIEHYVSVYNCSPVTHAPMSAGALVPNRLVLSLIQKFQQTGAL